MSEPRKLYTGSASGGLDQEQYEAARRRAQQLAEQNARRRTVQQPMRTAQLSLPGVVLTICHPFTEQQFASAVQVLKTFRPLPETEQKNLIEAAEKLRRSGKLNPCGDCCCSRINPELESRTPASCPFSIHPKNRRFPFL